MSDPQSEPVRLLDDPGTDEALRHDLEIASTTHAAPFALDAGLARFEETLAGGASTVPPGGSVAGLRILGWFVGAVALIGGSIAAYTLGPGERDGQVIAASAESSKATAPADNDGGEAHEEVRNEGDPVAGRTPSDASGVGSSMDGSGAPVSVAEAGEGSGAGDAGAAADAARAEGGSPALDAPTPPRPASKSSGEPALDEARQINEARKALVNDPARALAITEAAEGQFPNGAMVQERRGYAILALVALGRRDEASARARAYLERWPNGPLSRRVRDALP